MDPVATAAVGAGFGVVASLVTTVTTTTMTRRFGRYDSIREQDPSAAERVLSKLSMLLEADQLAARTRAERVRRREARDDGGGGIAAPAKI